MKILISEEQLEMIKKDLGEDYPESWNIDVFKGLNSFKSRVEYCDKHLVKIASGSSRIAYKIDEEKVLKLAKNKKGLAQNEVEISHGEDYYLEDIVAKIFEYDENNLWVEMELARKVTPEIFKRVVGYTFEEFAKGIHYLNLTRKNIKNLISRKPPFYDDMWENDFINGIFDYIINYEIPGDMGRMSSYGLVKRNGEDKIVLIDFGLTSDVLNTYYK